MNIEDNKRVLDAINQIINKGSIAEIKIEGKKSEPHVAVVEIERTLKVGRGK